MPSTLGAVIYAVRWPNPVAQVFGFHEVFHVFVLSGSLTHFVFMMRYVLPGALARRRARIIPAPSPSRGSDGASPPY